LIIKADNGGLRKAYNAYKKLEATKGKEQLLPGLDYDAEQLFFISFGQLWCDNKNKKQLKHLIANGNALYFFF
jgi:predicted metalloendopeptidase